MNFNSFLAALIIVLPVSVVSYTVTRSELFATLRNRIIRPRSKWLGQLVTCPYCFSHWVAFPAVWWYHVVILDSGWWFVDYWLSTFFIVGLASPAIWLVQNCFSTPKLAPKPYHPEAS